MNGYPELQNSLHASVRRVGIGEDLAHVLNTVIPEGTYLWATQLIQIPEVARLEPDSAKLSIILSDLYRRKMVGREYKRRKGSMEKFRYGRVGATSVVFSHKKPKATPKRTPGYELGRTFTDPTEALRAASAWSARITALDDGRWLISVTYPDSVTALRALAESVGVEVKEVKS